ncbi:MAG: hypothetical protein ACRD29_09320 [Acidimicrobiales bacterium]
MLRDPPQPGEERRVGDTISRSLQQQVERVASAVSDAGASVGERLPDIDWEAMYLLFGGLVGTITAMVDPGSQWPDEERTRAWYLEAMHRRDRIIATSDAFFDDIDAVLMPPP